MDERCWLQSVALAFLTQIAGSKLSKFLVDERCELIQSLQVTFCPLGQQQRQFVGIRHKLRIENAPSEVAGLYTAKPVVEPRPSSVNKKIYLTMIGFSSDF